ncbi:MAG: LacI family DNA-binding transcriptional regulator [Flavisolibacter sp.]
MSSININDLAKQLHLSKSTVSKALRDSYEISQETKKKVLELAQELHYVPNPYASSLRRKKSNTIGVVIPEVADSFFSGAIKGIESVARDKGYHVLIYLTYENYEREKAILKDFGSGRVDGVLMSVSSETPDAGDVKTTMDKKIPLVFFDRVVEGMNTAKIITNDFESSYEATSHLINRGCKRIAYLSISKHLTIINKRMEGYQKACFDHKIKCFNNDVVECSNDNERNYTIVKGILSKKSRPDGLIASVEKLTTPVYRACKELGLLISKDVKVISFSNLETASILTPTLTTVRQPAFEMGKTAATILFKAIEKRNFQLKKEYVVIPSYLEEGDSTK